MIDKQKKHLQPIHSFSSLLEARQKLKSLIDQFELCAKLCFIDVSAGATLVELKGELPNDYNKRKCCNCLFRKPIAKFCYTRR